MRFEELWTVVLWLGAAIIMASAASARPVTFESGPVRPLALSSDRTRLFAVNTPDGQLEIFDVSADGSLTRAAAVAVGLEPVAVAVRNAGEVWVVNHMSDSVSIVDVSTVPARVIRTLLVGDEPRDIVFAGSGGARAFITTARRGQNHVDQPRLRSAGTPRASVWVFDADNLGSSLGGNPIEVLNLFGDTPRALAVSPDGGTVYAAVFHSGNRTTTINEQLVCDGFQGAPPCNVGPLIMPGGLPGPSVNSQGIAAPETGLIVKFNDDSGHWEDTLGRNWDVAVNFSLPDYDVFAIDANATPPVQSSSFAGVGTVLFNMAVNPQSGRVYVSNTEARNEIRFEGPGKFVKSTVRGRLHQARITVLDGDAVLPRHLNKHLDYNQVPASTTARARSLATPLDMVLSSNGATLYLAAFGSNKVGIFDTAQLEADSFVPSATSHIAVPGGGPAGLALNEPAARLYVLTRFDNGISVIDLAKKKEVQHVGLHNPEPFSVSNGRRFLYDAVLTSSNGEASCSACHVFGDLDDLAWDLGNPDERVQFNPNPFRVGPFGDRSFHPMKGPMTTQTLRGMSTHGPLHWRGDRTGGAVSGSHPLDEVAAFKEFNPAFEGLIGRRQELSDDEMQAFTDFIMQVKSPPNPIRNLDNSLDAEQQAGRNFYMTQAVDGPFTCNFCHVLDPAQGKFGADGFSSFEGEPQLFKVAHLRNMYSKVGMFGMVSGGGDVSFQGEQIRGFGYLHDGSIDTTNRFLRAGVFNFPNNTVRRNVEEFMFAFDTDFAPIVGQQITLTDSNAALAGPRVDLLLQRAAAGECDAIVKGTIAGEMRGAYRTATGDFQMDRAAEAPISDAGLRAVAAVSGQELTYTCVPPGTGVQLGVDRDGDTAFDGDERDAATDPGDETSLPSNAIVCGSGAIIENAVANVSRNVLPAGDERITLKGQWVVTPAVPQINPLAAGFRVRIDDKDGIPIFNRVVRRGAPIGKGQAGWAVNRTHTRWSYRNPFGRVPGGVRRLTITDRSAVAPGMLRFVLSASGSDFYVDPARLPLRMIVVLGGTDEQGLGQCASVAFQPRGGGSPECRARATAVGCS